MGSWSAPVGNYANTNHSGLNCSGTAGAVSFTAGHPVKALWFEQNTDATGFLYRDAVAGRPELNRMNTNLDMGGNTVFGLGTGPTPVSEGDDCSSFNAGSVITNAQGRVLSCQNGLWELQASKHWRDPVDRYADLPTCNADRVGSTYIVKRGAAGSPGEELPRPFHCRESSPLVYEWKASLLDNNGNLIISGTASANDLYIDRVETEQTSCSMDGLVARDATGNLLSCTGGTWGPVARSPRTYRYVFTEDEIWTVPNGVKSAFVTMAGGGSSGVSYGVLDPLMSGNSGGYVFSQPINFVEGERIRITVGKGGKAVSTYISNTLVQNGLGIHYVSVNPKDPNGGLGGYPGTSSKLESIDRGELLLECAGGSGPHKRSFNSFSANSGPGPTAPSTIGLYSSTGRPYIYHFDGSFTDASGPYAAPGKPGRCGPIASSDPNYGMGNYGQVLYGASSGAYIGGTTPFGYGSGATVWRSGCYITPQAIIGTCTSTNAGNDGIVFIDVTY
jgi:hypothetical protein